MKNAIGIVTIVAGAALVAAGILTIAQPGRARRPRRPLCCACRARPRGNRGAPQLPFVQAYPGVTMAVNAAFSCSDALYRSDLL